MAWFMVRLEGEGMTLVIPQDRRLLWGLLAVKRNVRVTGFYTTRYVQSDHADAAIEIAKARVRQDLEKMTADDDAALKRLALKVDGVAAVDPKDVDSSASGFTFFDE